ncbi:hypothetical protein AB0O26_12160, partial [Micrococcus luteus]|uniref:hypothetical protein n=1 Tax=Micrococcus luteus TaxID=1270 RepID=UPI003423F32E
MGERPPLPARAGGEHLEPGRVFEGASRPWIHCQTRPRPVWPEGEPDSELGDEERSCTGVGPSGHDDGGPPMAGIVAQTPDEAKAAAEKIGGVT